MVSMQNRWVRIALYCLWRVLLGCMFALKRIPFWLLALVVFILVAYIFWERKGNQLSRLPWLDQPADAAAGLGGLWVALCGFHLVPAYVGTWGDFGGAGRADMHGVALAYF